MSDSFYGKKDMEKLAKLFALKPDVMKAFMEFDGKVFSDSALNIKTKELIAVACAHVTQCPYCIEGHTKRAKKAGATDEEIAESVLVAAAMRAGGSLAHSCIAMEVME
jgi:AhpD family alkylhydroperoxidase